MGLNHLVGGSYIWSQIWRVAISAENRSNWLFQPGFYLGLFLPCSVNVRLSLIDSAEEKSHLLFLSRFFLCQLILNNILPLLLYLLQEGKPSLLKPACWQHHELVWIILRDICLLLWGEPTSLWVQGHLLLRGRLLASQFPTSLMHETICIGISETLNPRTVQVWCA